MEGIYIPPDIVFHIRSFLNNFQYKFQILTFQLVSKSFHHVFYSIPWVRIEVHKTDSFSIEEMCNSSAMQGVLELDMNNYDLSPEDLQHVLSCKNFTSLEILELKGKSIDFDTFRNLLPKASFLSCLNVFTLPSIKGGSCQEQVDLFVEIADTHSPLFFRKAGNIMYANKMNSKGFDLYLKAAELGHSLSQYSIGREFEFRKDYNEAFKWFSKASQQGIVKSQCKLGSFYAKGKGTEKNVRKAFEWTIKAAKKGHVRAQYNLNLIPCRTRL